MTLIRADRVAETTTSTGTGPIVPAGAIAGYQPFEPVMADGDTCYYTIEAIDADGVPTGAWESGLGTWATATGLTRTEVHASSNANAAVNFAAGTKRMYINVTVDDLIDNFGGGAPSEVQPRNWWWHPPLAADFPTTLTSDTTNPTKIDDTDVGLRIMCGPSELADEIRGFAREIPSPNGDWSAEARFLYGFPIENYIKAGFILRSTATGKAMVFGMASVVDAQGTPQVTMGITRYTDLDTYASDAAVYSRVSTNTDFGWIKVTFTAATQVLRFFVTHDGKHWRKIWEETLANFFITAPDQIGMGCGFNYAGASEEVNGNLTCDRFVASWLPAPEVPKIAIPAGGGGGGGGGATALDELTDVSAAAPTDRQVLTWSVADQAWVAATPGISGGHIAATHWRLHCTLTQDGGAVLAIPRLEFREVAGVAQQATGGIASASSSFDSGNDASKAFDNDDSSQWHTGNGVVAPHWIAYAFATPKAIKEVAILPRPGFLNSQTPEDFTIQYSLDEGATWVTVETYGGVTGWDGSLRLFTVDPIVVETESINKHYDVDTQTVPPTAGQTLIWDDVNDKWVPGTVAGGGGGGGGLTRLVAYSHTASAGIGDGVNVPDMELTFVLAAETLVRIQFTFQYTRGGGRSRFMVRDGANNHILPIPGTSPHGKVYGWETGEGSSHQVDYTGFLLMAAGTHTLRVRNEDALANSTSTFYSRSLSVEYT